MSSPTDTKSSKSLNWLIWVALLGLLPLAFIFFSKSEDQTALLYQQNCGNCHMTDGQGLKSLFPPLANSDYLTEFETKLPCIIRHGMQGEIEVNGKMYNQVMPGNTNLTDVDITNLVNYIRNEWGNTHPRMNLNQVKEYLNNCEQ